MQDSFFFCLCLNWSCISVTFTPLTINSAFLPSSLGYVGLAARGDPVEFRSGPPYSLDWPWSNVILPHNLKKEKLKQITVLQMNPATAIMKVKVFRCV